jgi:predicted nucleic acid-binding protein
MYMRVYLDNCAINRPFDDLRQERIYLEAEVVMLILARVQRFAWVWIGSDALDIEISLTPDQTRRWRLQQVVQDVSVSIQIGQAELERSEELGALGFSSFDAAHLACAEAGQADIFLTTDDRLLKTAKRVGNRLRVKVANPLDWVKELL